MHRNHPTARPNFIRELQETGLPIYFDRTIATQGENMNFTSFKFSMKVKLLGQFQHLLLKFGIFARPSSPRDITEIIEQMKPRKINKELIMIGDGGDGTYILPDDLLGVAHCFSPGVGPVAKFEENLFLKFGINSFLIDASVDSIPSDMSEAFVFDKLFLGATTRPGFISLQDWVLKYAGSNSDDLLLQIDIEGAEYAALLATPADILKRFRIIAIELHNLDMLYLPQFRLVFSECLSKLREDFVVCYAHPNNCCGSIVLEGKTIPRVIELTLARKDRVEVEEGDVDLSRFSIDNTGLQNTISLQNWND